MQLQVWAPRLGRRVPGADRNLLHEKQARGQGRRPGRHPPPKEVSNGTPKLRLAEHTLSAHSASVPRFVDRENLDAWVASPSFVLTLIKSAASDSSAPSYG